MNLTPDKDHNNILDGRLFVQRDSNSRNDAFINVPPAIPDISEQRLAEMHRRMPRISS
jgi:hypothetical protein